MSTEKKVEIKVVSKEKEEFLKLIEEYKKKNPAKYELKKEAFEAKLASL